MAKVSMSYLFSFSRYQTKCVMNLLFRQLMTSESLRFILGLALKQWQTGKKIGEGGNTKIWLSREGKELFRWNKKYLSSFLKDCHLVKKAKIKKIAATSLKYSDLNILCNSMEMSVAISLHRKLELNRVLRK